MATTPATFLSVSMCFHRRVCHSEDNTSGGTHGASGVRATTGCSDEWRGGKNLSTKVAKRAGTASEKDSVPNQDPQTKLSPKQRVPGGQRDCSVQQKELPPLRMPEHCSTDPVEGATWEREHPPRGCFCREHAS